MIKTKIWISVICNDDECSIIINNKLFITVNNDDRYTIDIDIDLLNLLLFFIGPFWPNTEITGDFILMFFFSKKKVFRFLLLLFLLENKNYFNFTEVGQNREQQQQQILQEHHHNHNFFFTIFNQSIKHRSSNIQYIQWLS